MKEPCYHPLKAVCLDVGVCLLVFLDVDGMHATKCFWENVVLSRVRCALNNQSNTPGCYMQNEIGQPSLQ